MFEQLSLGKQLEGKGVKKKLFWGGNSNSKQTNNIFIFLCLDMIKRRNLRTRNIKMLILDEADEMLNKGTRTG